jgi:hypothetical protein
MEFGPYVYREYDNLTKPEEWDVDLNVPGQNIQKKGINMIYT